MFLFLVPPNGYGWGYRGWGAAFLGMGRRFRRTHNLPVSSTGREQTDARQAAR